MTDRYPLRGSGNGFYSMDTL